MIRSPLSSRRIKSMARFLVPIPLVLLVWLAPFWLIWKLIQMVGLIVSQIVVSLVVMARRARRIR